MQEKSEKKLNSKVLEYFKYIVDMYIETGEPVGSKKLVSKYNLTCSSATIRNIMAQLEKEGFLEKQHTSGGRIPSTLGLEFYTKKLVYNPKKFFENKLEDLLAKRRLNVQTTLDEAAGIVSEMAGFAIVASSNNNSETLKSIQLTTLNDFSAVVVLVTSSGNVQNKIFKFEKELALNDLRIAIRLFKERLVDTPLISLSEKVEALAPILAEQVKNYEIIIQQFIKNIFTFEEKIENKAFNKNSIILSENIERTDLVKILDLIDNHSVWETLENNIDEDNNIKLDFSRPNLNIISKKIGFNNLKNIKELSIVGPKNINISESLEVLDMLEKVIKNENEGEGNE
ncbi:heat-inducible transcriptional repressor HrcA [Mycoplasma struthionis]|uniref:Heat-inducible transcription repressor HrcA n=1 Tax=Mycoplasma struthionis TaxID=538220 RepID=A0A502M2T7_9MOLU|nr:heat-inducible transcriptional repressor HrcA [Mycoplasma struthionis]TPI02404.1 heat-inducible transcriptional repressor HrcA [Mycoplasma struthionis]